MIELERSRLALMMECGYILVGMQRFKEAREVFDGIMVLAPDSEIPVVALGSVAFCEGKFKDAVKWYHKALKLNDTSAFAKAYLGEALFFLGQKDDATAQLKAAIATDGEGKAGVFAKTLLEAIGQGFTPRMISGADDLAKLKSSDAAKGGSHAQ